MDNTTREVEQALSSAIIAIRKFNSQSSAVKTIQLSESANRGNNIGQLVNILLSEAAFMVRPQGRNCPTCNGTGKV